MKFGIIGAGKMGSAIINGITKNNLFEKKDVIAYDVNSSCLDSLENQGFSVAHSISTVFEESDVVLLAVKPQEFSSVLSANPPCENVKLLISIMAGVSISSLQKLSPSLAIARVMPNTCALIGESASAISFNDLASDSLKSLAKNIFNSIGTYQELPESLMDDVIPIGGSFTAYAYLFMKAFIDSSVKRGISETVARELVIQSMIGSSKMVQEYKDIDTLISNVCSKGGTTLAGLEKLYNADFEKIIDDCAIACANRSKELGKLN